MKHIFGQWSDPRGISAASGMLHLSLNQDAVIYSISQAAPREVGFALDKNGALMAGSLIWANDELTPSGTYYTATVSIRGGGVIWGPQWLVIAGSDPINLSRILPIKVVPPTSQILQPGTGIKTMDLSSDNMFGQPQPGQLVLLHTFAFQSMFPVNFADPASYATVGGAATAPATYIVHLNGLPVGTVTFSPSSPVVFQTTGFVGNPGDRLTMTAPDPMDMTLTDVAISLAYTRLN
jgi:hypothetical protein